MTEDRNSTEKRKRRRRKKKRRRKRRRRRRRRKEESAKVQWYRTTNIPANKFQNNTTKNHRRKNKVKAHRRISSSPQHNTFPHSRMTDITPSLQLRVPGANRIGFVSKCVSTRSMIMVMNEATVKTDMLAQTSRSFILRWVMW